MPWVILNVNAQSRHADLIRVCVFRSSLFNYMDLQLKHFDFVIALEDGKMSSRINIHALSSTILEAFGALESVQFISDLSQGLWNSSDSLSGRLYMHLDMY